MHPDPREGSSPNDFLPSAPDNLLTISMEADRLDRIVALAWEAARDKHNADNAREDKQILRAFCAEIESAKA